jgi:CMP-N,N'-diacetyllegionaminic acid synthase
MILGSICCRGGSKGVPGKNIRPLLGKPLIEYTIETGLKSLLIDELIVSTDSEVIASIASSAGVNVPFLRPLELASDTANKWDVFRHLCESWESINNKTIDYLVDLDVTVPLKTEHDIDDAINMALSNPDTDVVITGYDPERNPYFNMMEVTSNGTCEIVKKTNKPIVRRQDAPKVYSLTPAAFVIKRSAIFHLNHWSEGRCRVYPMDRYRAIDIDTEFDFDLVEFIMKKNKL